MRLPSFQAPFQGKSEINHGNPRTNSGGGEGRRGGGRQESQDALLFAAEKDYPARGLPAVPALACSGLCWPCRLTQDDCVSPPGHQPGITFPAPWALTPACPPVSSPGGDGGPAPSSPEPWWAASCCCTPAAGSQVSLSAATRRKLFELARAFSEKTKMRKSKRKHLLKHQSYPFWSGTGRVQWVLKAPGLWAP